ncbi:extracellular solute-binding protein [Cellulosimicrobium cellulans]|uniref:extracellular solute-binding protein n=1 Tax=Cellulosimicrobium cellulans TaxID=1710 RepID=UPI00130D4AE1|nr:extracellular solute-binding protein [Cellulosimicrobium cellulans]
MTAQRPASHGAGTRRRRGPLLAAAAALTSVAVAACSGSPGSSSTGADGGTITVWGSSDSGLEPLIEKFESEHPQYTVKYTKYSWDALDGKLVAAMAGGAAPDVSQAADMEVGQFAALGGLAPLDDFMAEQGYADEDFLPASWDYFASDGRTWAAPAYTDVRGLFYREDLFEAAGLTEPPATLDDLVADGIALGDGADVFGFADQTGQLDVHLVSWLVYAFGGDFYSADHTTATVTSAPVIEALEYYQDLYTHDVAPGDPAKRVDPWQGFKEGYYAMAHSGPWWMGLQRNEAPELAGTWALAPLPEGPTSSTVYGHPNPWIVPANAANKDGAHAWLAFMLDPENQAQWYTLTGLLPSRVAAYSDPQVADDAMLQQWLELGQRPANSIHGVPNGQAIAEAVYALSGDLKSGADVQEAARVANDKIQQLLNG